MKANLTNYRQSPRKVRLVANLVKGKPVPVALTNLDLLGKRASLPIKKLILSAVANASNNHKVSAENLTVKEITVDKGLVMKRFMPRARGSAFRIKKRTSHVHVVLAEKTIDNKRLTGNKKKIKKG